jgi:hypothetical protein
MAVKREQLVHDSEAARCRPIELITENDFSIVRVSEVDGSSTPSAGPYAFLVRDPHGYELDIAVEIDGSAVLEVVKRSEGRISAESSYWICCAERHLADYLLEHDDYPPAATLEVDRLTPNDLDCAMRWQRNWDV